MKKLLLITIIAISGLIFGASEVNAANVNINVSREFTVTGDSKVVVKESRTVVNNTSNRTITKQGNFEVFTITALYEDANNKTILEQMVKSAVVRAQEGWNLNYSVEYKENSAVLTVPYPSSIDPGKTYTFSFEYTNTQLAQKSGALLDVYIQAFSKDFSFISGEVAYTYTTRVRIPTSFGEENFANPAPASKTNDGTYDIYVFNQTQLLGDFVWIQRGKSQFYKFALSQSIKATEDVNTGNKNEYKIIIPRSFDGLEVFQNVYFTNLSPNPDYIEQDFDGNLIGVFKFPSHEDAQIRIEGYSVVATKDNINIQDAGTLSDLTGINSVYVSSGQYWESDAQQIKDKVNEITNGMSSIYQILDSTYREIVDTIDYSNVKRFGLNERQGALKTLQGGAAVCMEYSDLYIAMLRAKGVPARAAFGYGYDSKDPADAQELHQWVQVYNPKQDKWLSVDVTWGENGPALIGGDMNHFLTHVASINPNEPPTLSGRTFGSQVEFEELKFTIETLATLPEEEHKTPDELLSEFKKPSENGTQAVFDSFIDKFEAGLESIAKDGIDFTNSAQVIVFATLGIALILIIFWITIFVKLLKRRSAEKLHSGNTFDPQ